MKKLLKENEFLKIIIGGTLFLCSIFVKSYFFIYLLLIILSYIILSYEVFFKAYQNIKNKELFDENFLMVLATMGAFSIREYPEAVMVMLLYQIGEYLGDLATSKSKQSIVKLMDLQCDIVHLESDDTVQDVDIEKVKKGDFIVVKPGEKIPLDGTIIEGESLLDTSKLTGESVPRKVKVNDYVLSGSVNKNKVLRIKTSTVLKDSTAYKIMKLMEEAESKKTKTEKFITKFAHIYTPVVTISAFLIAFYPFLFGGSKIDFFYKAISFLVVSCPCALVISVPLCFFLAIGRGAREGILFKGSQELDELRKIDTFVFDKTGTITKGIFKVTKINSEFMKEEELLEMVAHAEFYSNHPIAGAIIESYKKKIDRSLISNYEEIPGCGISCIYKGKKIKVGNQKLVPKSFPQENFGTVVFVSVDNVFAGSIVVSDELKESAINALYLLQNVENKNVVMVSGDHEPIVKKVSQKLKIASYFSEMLPTEKVKIVNDLKKDHYVAFIGDGINDAPACKCAHIGIAMGDMGTDSVLEASDIVIMRDNLLKIISGISLSKKTNRIVWINIIFALFVKVLFLLLGFFSITSIWMAVFGDVGVTLLVVLHSMRILKIKL